MSTDRTLSHKDKQESYRLAREKKLCRYCGLDVKRFNKKARTFCSPQCIHQHLVRSDPGYVREQVYKRDHGICAQCGLDCSKWFSDFHRWLHSLPLSRWNTVQKEVRDHAIREFFLLSGVSPAKGWEHRTTFWDADHIHPVAEGGGLCGLEGYQTLCLICHRKKTADQKRAKATGKTLSASPPVEEPKQIKVVQKPPMLVIAANGKLVLRS